MGAIMAKGGKNCQEEQMICNCCLIISLCFERRFLALQEYGYNYINFAELWLAFFSDMSGIMGIKFEPK